MVDFKSLEQDVFKNKDEIIEKLTEFANTDTILFFSGNNDVKQEQKEKWLPVLHRIETELNLKFTTTDTLCPPQENEQSLEAYKRLLYELPLKSLTVLYFTALKLKSPLLSLAYVNNYIDIEKAYDLAFLEETCQNKKWGSDEEAEKCRQAIKDELYIINEYKNND